MPAWLRARATAPLLLLALGLALCLPRLGSFGLWEPKELAIAEAAAAHARAGAVVGPALADGPAGRTLLPGLGLAWFGVREGSARLLVALSAVATLLALFWAGAGLFGRRAGALGALTLAVTPLFVLEARQLTTDMPLLLGGALALGGLGRFAAPAAGGRRLRDLAVGVLGLGVGTLAGGVLMGVLLPCLSLGAALALAWKLELGAPEPDGRTLGRDLLGDRPVVRAGFALLAFLALALAISVATGRHVAGRPSWLLGGTPQLGPSAHSFVALLRRLGFGLFPFAGLAFFALGQPLVALDEPGGRDGRRALGGLLCFFQAAFGLALGTVSLHLVGEPRPVAVLGAALAVGAFLGDRWTAWTAGARRSEAVLAFMAALGTLLVARDFKLSPEELVSVHLDTKIAWPPTLSVGGAVLGAGALFAAGLVAFLLAPRPSWPLWARRATAAGLPTALVAALAFAVFLAQGVVPAVSKHVSRKALVESYHRLRSPDSVLLRYRVAPEGGGAFDRTTMTEVASAAALATIFRERPSAFALWPREELAALDDGCAAAHAAYAVVDASSSRTLLVAARLPAGATDQHPLAASLWHAPEGQPAARPPWPAPAVPVPAVFGDAIELLGADYPANVHRPGRLPLTLHFRVRQRPPADYKIFVHLQAPGQPLVNGDHAPLGGAYPTQHWRPGDELRDQHAVDLPLVTTSAGRYALYCGFWPGGDNARRLPVTAGAQDGQNRVPLGTVQVD